MPCSCPVVSSLVSHQSNDFTGSNFRTLKEVSNQLTSYGSHMNVQRVSLFGRKSHGVIFNKHSFTTLVHGHKGLMGNGFLLHLKKSPLQVHKYRSWDNSSNHTLTITKPLRYRKPANTPNKLTLRRLTNRHPV